MIRANIRSTTPKSQYTLKEVEFFYEHLEKMFEELQNKCGNTPPAGRITKGDSCYDCENRRICYDVRSLASYVLTEIQSGEYK